MKVQVCTRLVLALGFAWFPALADGNIEACKCTFSLNNRNRANVVRLKNDNALVTYTLQTYINAWEIDGPDDQLGGALCIRINRAGGRYAPGCLLCREGMLKTYLPGECAGVLTPQMLRDAMSHRAGGAAITFIGRGMRILLKV